MVSIMWLIVGLSGCMLLFAPVLNRALAKKIDSFNTKVISKEKKSVVIFTGFFIPIPEYFLKVEQGFEVKIDADQYRAVTIGDLVQVAKYSDGSYRLE